MFVRLLFSALISLCAVSAMAAGLKVGVSADYPPMVYKQEGRIVGIEADNAKALSAIIGQEMTLVDMPFEQLIPALVAGDIDVIMSGMSVTSERSGQVLFTDSFMEVGQMAIMTTEKVGHFSQPWALHSEGVRIGVEPGTTGADYAAAELPNAEVKFFKDSNAAFAGLRGKDIDLYIHDAPTSWQLATTDENSDLISLYKPLTHEQLAWAVRKDDQRLAARLNDALQTLKRNGTLGYIFNRWVPVTVEVR
ncbi:MAG: transporter substrate-binding domain-containing protein [Halioglobus sp.]|nr:transporter substrate-binding domain-containing protein [Halioglobus sp.]